MRRLGKREVVGAISLITLTAIVIPVGISKHSSVKRTDSAQPPINGTVVAIAATGPNGLLFAASNGQIEANGTATVYGQVPSVRTPVVGMASLPGGSGYYVVTQGGHVYNFGSAPFNGDTYTYGITGLGGSKPLNAPIVGMATTPHGHGYWLVAADGGVFNFGSAKFYGSTYSYGITGLGGSKPLNAPITAIVPTPNGQGYWLVAKDGGVFDFGNAHFYGSTYTLGITGLISGAKPLGGPIVGATATPNGGGYYLVGDDGGVFDFGDAHFDGSTYSKGYTGLGGTNPLPAPVASIAPDPNGTGYWAVTQAGQVFSFGGAASMSGVSAITELTSSPLANPTANINSDSATYTCAQAYSSGEGPNNAQCIAAGLALINYGNATEGLGPMSLPANFDALSPQDQMLILVNNARIERGLPPIYGITGYLSSTAQQAAPLNEDPIPPVMMNFSSDWATESSTTMALAGWLYDDGPGPFDFNVDCNGIDGTNGCFGHRHSILAPVPSQTVPVMGAGYAPEPNDPAAGSYTMLFAWLSNNPSSTNYTYTWAQALADGA